MNILNRNTSVWLSGVISTFRLRLLIQGVSLATSPKLLSAYTVEQRGFLVRKYLQTGSFNLFTPNDDCSGRTAPLTSKRSILYIHSTNMVTEYFKHGIYSLRTASVV